MSESMGLLQQGIAAAKAGRKKEARQILTQVVDLDERNEQAWLWLSGVVETAEERRICLENVLAINPDNAHAHSGLAWLDQQTAATATAQDQCPRCQAAVPSSAATCPGCGLPLVIACPACDHYVDVERTACDRCGQLLGDVRQGARYHLGLAQAYAAQRKVDRALEAVARAEAEVDNDPQVLAAGAALYAELSRVDLAIPAYQRAIEVDPLNPALYTRLGALYQQRSNPDLAQAAYQRAAELAGQDIQALLALADLSLKAGDAAQAIELLQQALQQQPMNAQIHLLLGDAFQQKGDLARAWQAYQQARTLAPADSDASQQAAAAMAAAQSALELRPGGSTPQRRGATRTTARQRPGCLTLYVVLMALGGLSGLCGVAAMALFLTGSQSMLQDPLFVQQMSTFMDYDAALVTRLVGIYSVIMLVMAGANLAIAAGLWFLKNWARIAVIVLQVLSMLGSLIQLLLSFVGYQSAAGSAGGQGYPTMLLCFPLLGFVVQAYIIFWFVANRELFD